MTLSRTVVAAAVTSVLLRLVFLLALPGFVKGDEVEVLEAAFHRALGREMPIWDLRNLFLPDVFVAPFVAAAHRVGFDGTFALIVAGTIPFLVAGGLSTLFVGLLAERWGLSRTLGGLAAWIYALHWIPLVYGSATFPRVITTALILAAVLTVERSGSRAAAIGGGLLLALACACRYGDGSFLVPLLVIAGLGSPDRSRYRRLALFLGFALGVLMFVAVTDWLTWGKPFVSLANLVDFTRASFGAASPVRTQPVYWYAWRVPHWAAPTAILLIIAAVVAKRARSALWFIVLPIAFLSVIPYKDYRYLQPVIPFVAILTAGGFGAVSTRFGRRTALALLGITFLWQADVAKLRERSAPAVAVSSNWCADRSAVAFSQPWAYGSRLFVPDETEIHELSLPPRADEIGRLGEECSLVAFYAGDETPELMRALERHGFDGRTLVHRITGKDVVFYTKR